MKKVKKRYDEVDLLKAFAALLVVLIHVLSYYRNDSRVMYLFWDLSHFSVGLFVLVAGFLQANSVVEFSSIKEIGLYLYKKFKRIVFPYYKFAILFIIITILLGKATFSDFLEYETIKNTIFLWGGVGNNWIPRLFMGFTVVVILETLLSKKFKYVKQVFFAISLVLSVYLLFRDLDLLKRFNNMPGWLVIFYTGEYIFKRYSKNTLFKVFLLSSALTAFLFAMNTYLSLERGIFESKWPPTIYYASYNIAAITLTWLVVLFSMKYVQKHARVNRFVKFLSINSYEIFFYHLLVLEIVTFKINWFFDWIIVFSLTVVLVWFVKWVGKYLKESINKRGGVSQA